MKKFKFSLDSVLSYKEQMLDVLKGEHAVLLGEIRAQEERLADCWARYRAYNEEYCRRSREGLPITEALICQSSLRAMEREIQQETTNLETLRTKEEKKREEVVEARKETSSIEKLKEKKLTDYRKAEAKSEELFVEEFVSMTRLMEAPGT